MRPLKKAEQKNVIVATEYYREPELKELAAKGVITPEQDIFYNKYEEQDGKYRIFTADVKDLKVVYNDEFGYYETVAVMNSGEVIHVNI